MDTASVGIMTIPPFQPRIRNGLLYGRGACDTKAGGVAMMYAMKRIKESGVKPPCTIKYAGAVDEEHLFRGALQLAKVVKAEAAVISEPTELAVVRAHKGLARFRIHVKGVAAHSSKPHLGVNAISKMTRIIAAIEDEIIPTYANRTHPLTGGPTLNVGLISGGAQVNFVPDRCVVEIDRRVIPGETPEETFLPFRGLLARLQAADPKLDVSLESYLTDHPMETPEDALIVQVAAGACQAVSGNSTITGVPYGTDASKFTVVGVPAIVLGPGNIDQAHAAVEWVACDQVLRAVDIYQRIMMTYGDAELTAHK
jgi:acetylornithine deacetylase